MGKWLFLLLTGCMISVSCSSAPKALRGDTEVVDISDVDTSVPVTADNAEDILRKYIADFDVPNPLYGDSYGRNLQADPSHQSAILCRAVLLDDYSTQAYVQYQSVADSADGEPGNPPYDVNSEPGPREGMFRIRVAMESGFSDKSMDPDHWAIYLENARGTMIAPAEIAATPVTSRQDSVFQAYRQMNMSRHLMKRNLFLYFNTVTFFGEDLFGPDNPFIVLVLTRDKRTVARIAWITGDM